VHAALALQKPIGVVAADLKGDRLDAGLVAIQKIQFLDGQAHALGKAGVHAVEHLGPVLGLGAARAGVQRQDAVVLVVLAGEQRGQPERLQLLFYRRDLGGDLRHQREIIFLICEADQHVQIVRTAVQFLEVLDPGFHRARLLADLLRALRIVPETGRSHVLLEFG